MELKVGSLETGIRLERLARLDELEPLEQLAELGGEQSAGEASP